MKILPLSLAACMTLTFAACDQRSPEVIEKPAAETSNFETTKLGLTIDAYIAGPSDAKAADVDRAFAELDLEIAELNQRIARSTGAEAAEAKAKEDNLRTYRDREMLRWTEARARAAGNEVGSAAREIGENAEDAARKVGEGVKDAIDRATD